MTLFPGTIFVKANLFWADLIPVLYITALFRIVRGNATNAERRYNWFLRFPGIATERP
jgi:hypothetical protein